MTIRVENVSKKFDISRKQSFQILKDISFTIKKGDFVVILGESGCGKSTLLNLLSGLIPPSSGEIRVNNVKITGPDPSRSIIFQQPSLLPWLNVEQNIKFGCRLRGECDKLAFRAGQLIDIMGLSGFENTYPAELSLGMAQRVCLARAFIGHPEILLLDEPFAPLDTFNRTHLQQELTDFWQIEQFTVVFVTHDIDEGILLGNKIILLGHRPGQLVDIFDIDLSYPRDVTHPDFIHIRNRIFAQLKASLFNHDRLRF